MEAGQTVAASMTAPKLFTIAQDLAHVQIEAQVDEADIGQVTRDNPVSFTVDAYPDVTFKGKVEQIRLAPVALNNVVTYTVVIDADNPLGRLLPGMTANVEIVTGEQKDVVVVPSEALRFQPRGPAQAALARDSWATGSMLGPVGERGARLLEKLKTELELGEDEMGKIKAALEAEFAAIQSAGPPGMAPMSDGCARAGAHAHRQGAARGALARAIQEIRGDGAAKTERPAPGHASGPMTTAPSGRMR